MNRLLKFLLALSAAVTLGGTLLAADDEPAQGRDDASAGERAPDGDGQADERDGFFRGRFTGPAGLNLNDEQWQKMEDLRKKFETEFRAILTPAQLTKLDEFRSRRADRESDDEPESGINNTEAWVERAMVWDVNKDGSLNKDELTKMAAAMAERRDDRGERRGERLDRRGERLENRGDRLEQRGERVEQRGEGAGNE